MDILFELILEVFGEALIELFVNVVSLVASGIITHFEANARSRKTLRIIIYGVCLISSMVLLALSYIHAKTAYALISAIFISVNISIMGIKLINKQYLNNNKKINILTIVLTRLSRLTFYVLIFVFLNTLQSRSAKVTLVTISTIVMAFFICIDLYRILHLNSTKVEEKKVPDEYSIDPKDY